LNTRPIGDGFSWETSRSWVFLQKIHTAGRGGCALFLSGWLTCITWSPHRCPPHRQSFKYAKFSNNRELLSSCGSEVWLKAVAPSQERAFDARRPIECRF